MDMSLKYCGFSVKRSSDYCHILHRTTTCFWKSCACCGKAKSCIIDYKPFHIWSRFVTLLEQMRSKWILIKFIWYLLVLFIEVSPLVFHTGHIKLDRQRPDSFRPGGNYPTTLYKVFILHMFRFRTSLTLRPLESTPGQREPSSVGV